MAKNTKLGTQIYQFYLRLKLFGFRITVNWTVNETRKHLSAETLEHIFATRVYIYDQIDWHLKNEDNRPQFEIRRENDTDQSGIFKFGKDLYSEISCKMNIVNFPFDKHQCNFMGTSNLYTAEVNLGQYWNYQIFIRF